MRVLYFLNREINTYTVLENLIYTYYFLDLFEETLSFENMDFSSVIRPRFLSSFRIFSGSDVGGLISYN